MTPAEEQARIEEAVVDIEAALRAAQVLLMERIRAGRDKPGLRPQHLTSVTAAKEVSNADVSGAEVGSRELTFRPRTVQGGNRTFSVGTYVAANSFRYSPKVPLARCARISAITVRKKCELWMLTNRNPRISFTFSRCRM